MVCLVLLGEVRLPKPTGPISSPVLENNRSQTRKLRDGSSPFSRRFRPGLLQLAPSPHRPSPTTPAPLYLRQGRQADGLEASPENVAIVYTALERAIEARRDPISPDVRRVAAGPLCQDWGNDPISPVSSG